MEQPRLGEPPEEGADRGQHDFDVDARRADGRPLPLARQHPGVGDVAVEAGRQHEDHDAHLVALAAEVLAGQPVAELVQHLRHAQHHRQQEGVVDAEELVELGQLRAEHVELDRHQRQRRQGQQAAQRHGHGEKNQRTYG